MSNNPILGFVEMAAGQQQPEVVVNAATRALARAGFGQITVNFENDADLILAADPAAPRLDQWPYRSVVVTDTGFTLTAGRNVILPDVDAAYGGPTRQLLMVSNQTLKDLTVVHASGGAGAAVPAGGYALLYFDGEGVRVVFAAATSATWSPADLPDLAVWYDADDDENITLVNGDTEVAAIADKSGNGVDLTAHPLGIYNPPVGVINGRRAITFAPSSGTERGLWKADTNSASISVLQSQNSSAFVVAKDYFSTASSTSARYLFCRNASSRAAPGMLATTISLTPTAYRSLHWTTSSAIVMPSAIYTGVHIAGFTYSNESAGTPLERHYGYVDGVQTAAVTNAGNPTPVNWGAVGDTSFSLGCFVNSGIADLSFNGQIGELIVVERVVTTDERQKIEGYLAHKWGIAANLPADHPYKAAPP